MTVAEFLASLKVGKGETGRAAEQRLPRLALNQFIVGFQLRASYLLGASYLSHTQLEAMGDENTGQKRFDLDHGYIKLINKADPDGIKVGIYIDDVWVGGANRSYRLLTTAPKGENRQGEVYFAEYYDHKGQRKLKDRQVDTTKATVEADRILNLAIDLASKSKNLS